MCPRIILSNGPAISAIIFYVSKIFNILFSSGIKLIFVESFCRVYSLSLTGKLVYWIADIFIV